MNRPKTLRTAFISAWLLLVVGIVVAIANQERFFAVDGKTIATLDKKNGSVQARQEGLVRWNDTVEKQGFFDGDRIATGRTSDARVGFGPGRGVSMGEDTQIQITVIVTSTRDVAYMVTLLRGAVVADVAGNCEDCPELMIRAGDDTYNVSAGKRIGVFKAVGRKARRFDPKKPWPTVTKPKQVKVVAVPPPKVESKPAPAPKAPPKAAPKAMALKSEGFEATLRAPSGGLTYYTVQPLAALGSVALEVPFGAPAERPKTGDWRPLVQISGGGTRAEVVQAARASDTSISVPIAKIRSVASANRAGLARDYVFSLRGGARLTDDKQKKVESFGERKLDFRIRTYGEYGGGPVTIGLDRLTAPTDPSPWIAAKTEVDAGQAPIVIRLAQGQDYSKFLPYIREATQLGLAAGGVRDGAGIYIVRDRAVVAQISGSGLNAAVIRKLMVQLRGDFVFDGPRSAFHDARGDSQTVLVDWIGALLDKGKVLYILKRNKLYPVSRDFIKTNSEVAQFVDSQAKAIFLEKVRILDFR